MSLTKAMMSHVKKQTVHVWLNALIYKHIMGLIY